MISDSKQCEFIKEDGTRCKAFKTHNSPFCWFHSERRAKNDYRVGCDSCAINAQCPYFESGSSMCRYIAQLPETKLGTERNIEGIFENLIDGEIKKLSFMRLRERLSGESGDPEATSRVMQRISKTLRDLAWIKKECYSTKFKGSPKTIEDLITR